MGRDALHFFTFKIAVNPSCLRSTNRAPLWTSPRRSTRQPSAGQHCQRHRQDSGVWAISAKAAASYKSENTKGVPPKPRLFQEDIFTPHRPLASVL
jgi:hypothetical protein